MRLITRAALVAAASIPLAALAPALASAAVAGDVTFSYSVTGRAVTNTITNNSGAPLTCATSLADAPGGVLPPVADVLSQGQSLYDNGDVPAGVTTQTITDVPDGSYVVLASCGTNITDPTLPMWISAYPGLEEYLTLFHLDHAFIAEQESTVITVPAADTTQPGTGAPDLGAIFGS